VRGVELAYTVLLVLALVLNGIALTGATPLREFFAPLRERRLVLRVVALDTILVPVLIVGIATLLRLDDATGAGLVIVAAASAGPIGVALARAGRGDMPLAVTLVTGIGLLNLLTVPVISTLLLPRTIPLPLVAIVTNLIGLLLVPLILGRAMHVLLGWVRATQATRARVLANIGNTASMCLIGAVGVALFLEPGPTIRALAGPITPIAIVTMLVVAAAARAITRDVARRRTIALVINARAVGLALTLAALHFSDVPGLRATVLAFGGLTQVVPILVVLVARRWRRVVAGRTG